MRALTAGTRYLTAEIAEGAERILFFARLRLGAANSDSPLKAGSASAGTRALGPDCHP